MTDGFAAFFRQVYGPLGVHVDDAELPLIQLLHDLMTPNYEPLLRAEIGRFPHEPVDPSRAPER